MHRLWATDGWLVGSPKPLSYEIWGSDNMKKPHTCVQSCSIESYQRELSLYQKGSDFSESLFHHWTTIEGWRSYKKIIELMQWLNSKGVEPVSGCQCLSPGLKFLPLSLRIFASGPKYETESALKRSFDTSPLPPPPPTPKSNADLRDFFVLSRIPLALIPLLAAASANQAK